MSQFLAEHAPIPGYEPIRPLLRNGAIVYLARKSGSGELVTLKVYDQGTRLGVAVPREALLARLQHPNILQVFEVGEFDGRVYAAVEHVERTLAHKLSNGPLQAPAASSLARTIALTLEYAHRQAVVHMGLPPAVILLTGEDLPKLFDFQPTEVVERWLAQKQAVFGNPAFLAPEDLLSGDPVSETAAVYRIGAALYAMLTGQPPFRGDSREVKNAVLSLAPTSPRRINPKTSRQADFVCLKCLEKRPDSRYSSLQELVAELEHCIFARN